MQGSHNSVEDAKAALAIYKFKSEIGDRHGLGFDETDFSLVETLAKNFPGKVSLVGPPREINRFSSFGFSTDAYEENTIEAVLDGTLRAIMRGDNLVIAKADILQRKVYTGEIEYFQLTEG